MSEVIDNDTGEIFEVRFPPAERASRVRERPRLLKHTGTETVVQQQFKNECDINHLMKRYQASGLIPQNPLKPPFYGDFSKVPDFQEAQNIVNEARDLFMSMSSDVRKRFDHDPAKFLEFCSNPDNGDELIKMGLREKPAPEPSPVKVEITNPPPVEPQK